MVYYPIAIVKDDDMSNYAALVPDVPGCFPTGDTIADTILNAQALLYDHIECLLEEKLPFDFNQVSSIEALKDDPEYAEVISWAVVAIDESKLSTAQVRFNVSWSEYMLNRVDDYIARHHETRSGFLAKAAIQAMAAG